MASAASEESKSDCSDEEWKLSEKEERIHPHSLGNQKKEKKRTVKVILIMNDVSKPKNEDLISYLFRVLITKEKLMAKPHQNKAKIKDHTLPVMEIEKITYDDFLKTKEDAAVSAPESIVMSIAVMTVMTDISVMNTVYTLAKKSGMRVIIALPPQTPQWCGMVDFSDASSEEDITSLTLINDEIKQRIESNNTMVPYRQIGRWVSRTIRSMAGAAMNQELSALYQKHGLLTGIHWCFSGVPLRTMGLLDTRLCIGYDSIWNIEKCTIEGMDLAVFTANDEMILAQKRSWISQFGQTPLFDQLNSFKVVNLAVTPLSYQLQSEDSAHCKAGYIEFDVIRDENTDQLPIKFDAVDLKEMEQVLSECVVSGITKDESVGCLIKSAVKSGCYSQWKGPMDPRKYGSENRTFSWFKALKHCVLRGYDSELSWLPKVLSLIKSKVDWQQIKQHWSDLLDFTEFKEIKQRVTLFEQCLMAAANEEDGSGHDAMDFALKMCDSDLIQAVYAYSKGLRSQSFLEDSMAESYARWTAQSGHFVKEYLLKEDGGGTALKALSDALVKFIRDRGDFAAVDLMGIVWHIDDATKDAVLKRLMLSLNNTLDYNTVSDDKIGWMWAKESVLKHPMWLCEQVKPPSLSKSTSKSLKTWLKKATGFAKEERNERDRKDILFDNVKAYCDRQAAQKGGFSVKKEFTQLVSDEPEQWKRLTSYAPKIHASEQLRQDLVGRKPDVSSEDIRDLSLQFNTLDFNVEKEVDSKAYLTGLLLDAHFVQSNFRRLMTEGLSKYGKFQIAPVKKAERVLPKSKEYAAEKKPHCYWPYSACVIDLVRCCVTVNTLAELLSALEGFESYLSEQRSSLSLVRCKNGFARFYGKDRVPKRYCDVKMNVACKDESGSKCVIGEVQFLLDCIMRTKKKGHELYEVSRMMPLFEGAKKKWDGEWTVRQQLTMSVDNPARLTRLLTFFPFQLNLHNDCLFYLFRSQWKDPYLIDQVSNAIVEKCGLISLTVLTDRMVEDVGRLDLIPIGVTRLMCAVISKVGSPSDCVSMMRKLIDCYAGKKDLYRAMIGLDDGIKSEIVYNAELSHFWNHDIYAEVSAAELASVLRGWKKTSEVRCEGLVFFLHYWSQFYDRRSDSTLSAGLRDLYEMSSEDFWKATGFAWAGFWTALPDYMVELVKECRDIHPEMMQGMLDRGFITEEELSSV